MDKITLEEYELLMKAVQLKQVDADYRNHLQAFLNFAVKAEKKVAKNKTKPVYTTFKKFFDYEKAIKRITQPRENSRFDGLKKFLRKEGNNNG